MMAWIGLVFLFLQLLLASCRGAAISVSLELQGGNCSDQITLICRHSDDGTAPQWIHNSTTVESGEALATAFPGANYTGITRTEHNATIIGVDSVRALDGYFIQCAYDNLGNLIKSNAVKFTFIPPDYQPALFLKWHTNVFHQSVGLTGNFFERISTCAYSYEESCRLYPRCTPYFSVEHTVSPPSVVDESSSECIVRYTFYNLTRCVSYQSTATALLGNQRGNTVVQGVTFMLGPGQFTITDASIGADRKLIKVTYMEYEPDCPGYPTEWYTVDVDGVKVADLTADAVQSLAINHAKGSVTLSLHLNQPLPENAVTLRMTKHNTVPTSRSNVKGNIVTEMVTWTTSHGLALRKSPPGGESQAGVKNDVVIGVSVSAGVALIVAVVGGVIAVIVFIKCRR